MPGGGYLKAKNTAKSGCATGPPRKAAATGEARGGRKSKLEIRNCRCVGYSLGLGTDQCSHDPSASVGMTEKGRAWDVEGSFPAGAGIQDRRREGGSETAALQKEDAGLAGECVGTPTRRGEAQRYKRQGGPPRKAAATGEARGRRKSKLEIRNWKGHKGPG
jgi:hypothetical protein